MKYSTYETLSEEPYMLVSEWWNHNNAFGKTLGKYLRDMWEKGLLTEDEYDDLTAYIQNRWWPEGEIDMGDQLIGFIEQNFEIEYGPEEESD